MPPPSFISAVTVYISPAVTPPTPATISRRSFCSTSVPSMSDNASASIVPPVVMAPISIELPLSPVTTTVPRLTVAVTPAIPSIAVATAKATDAGTVGSKAVNGMTTEVAMPFKV